jgi:cytochrome c553
MTHFVAAGLLGSLLLISAAAGAVQGDPAKAQAGVCAACHGADGNSPMPINPSLAGQLPEYLYKQLRDFKSGARKNAIMAGMVATLSDEDMRNLAAYFAAQKPQAGVAHNAAVANAGQKVYRAGNASSGLPGCAGCHSPNGVGIPVQFPRLKGQHLDYTLAQLNGLGSTNAKGFPQLTSLVLSNSPRVGNLSSSAFDSPICSSMRARMATNELL